MRDDLGQQEMPAIEVLPGSDGVESEEEPDSSSALFAGLDPEFTDLITDAVEEESQQVKGQQYIRQDPVCRARSCVRHGSPDS